MSANCFLVIVLILAVGCSPQVDQANLDSPVETGKRVALYAQQSTSTERSELVERSNEGTPLKEGVPTSNDPLASAEMKSHAKGAADLGWKYLKDGEIETALRRFGMAIRHDSDYVDGYYGIAYAYSLKGDVAEAENYYRKTLQKDPDHLYANANLGYALLQLGKEQEALEKLDKALSLNPDCGEAHLSYANYHAKNGNWEEAGESARFALKLNQTIHPEFINTLKSHGIELTDRLVPAADGT